MAILKTLQQKFYVEIIPPRLAVYSSLPLRLVIGTVFFAHGSQKLFGLFGGAGLSMTILTFRHYLGIPAFLTVLAAVIEVFGGILLAVGLMTRIAAAGLAVVMLVAIWKVHMAYGFFLNWFGLVGQGHGIEYNLVLLGGCLALFLSGGQGLSFDQYFRNRSNLKIKP